MNQPSRLNFRLDARATGSRARAATFRTLHNEVKTPLFMPVGTQATVKAQLPETLVDSGSQVLLANTYHLLLRPGPEVFRKFGGIHRFMKWDRSVLTDSGGFQIFSLPHSRSMTEAGAVFQSYVDGKTLLLSPELSIDTQRAIGSDIMMVLDQCIPSTASEKEARAAWELTHRWAARSLAARGDSPQSMFGIVQGALFPEIRRESVLKLAEMPFDGFAIGGLAVGEEKSQREDVCEFTAGLMPADKPRYLMGVGTPLDILEAVHRGVDMFDCIIPGQLAQRGGVFTSRGYLQLRRTVYRLSDEALDPACSCPTCARYSIGYLHHLHKAKEVLGWQLIGQHNLYFYHQLMREIRASILEDRFMELYRAKRPVLALEDQENPNVPRKQKRRKTVPARRGDYEIVDQEGFFSIRQTSSGEIMHSRTRPIDEAKRLYVDQAFLAERLLSEDPSPLVIWDVGLGAAANAMAAIRCQEELAARGPVRELKIVSFENDLDSLRLAFAHSDKFPYLRHGAPAGILRDGVWKYWTLVQGDFLEAMGGVDEKPDLIFFDLFSKKVSPDPWSFAAFQKIHDQCANRPVELFTYSCSTAVRTSLLASGFWVAKGLSTGEKTETTVALTSAARSGVWGARHSLLGAEWLDRWSRSGARFPDDASPERHSWFERMITGHVQFQNPGIESNSDAQA